MLVVLGAAGAPGRRDDFGLREQDLFDAAADFIRFRQRRARQGIGLHREAPLVEFGQERAAGARQRERRGSHQQQRHPEDGGRMVEDWRKHATKPALEVARQPAVMTALD